MVSERQTRAHLGFEKKHGGAHCAFFQNRGAPVSSTQKSSEINDLENLQPAVNCQPSYYWKKLVEQVTKTKHIRQISSDMEDARAQFINSKPDYGTDISF